MRLGHTTQVSLRSRVFRMHEDLLTYGKLALVSRIRRIIALLIVAYTATILSVRSLDTVYNAKIKVFVSSPNSQGMAGIPAIAQPGGMEVFEKKEFMKNQAALLYSYPIYEAVEA